MSAQQDRILVKEAVAEVRARIRSDKVLQPPRVRKLLEIIEENFRDLNFNVSTAVRIFGPGGPYATECFSKRMNMAPKIYLASRRVDVAKALLRESRMQMWQVAHESGFSDRTQLYRALLKIAGITPSAYRKRAGLLQATLRPHWCGSDPLEFLEGLYLGVLELDQIEAHMERLRRANPLFFARCSPPGENRHLAP